jgi:hypothetical protein
MGELVDKKFGEGEAKVTVSKGVVRFDLMYNGQQTAGGAWASVKLRDVLNEVAKKIPGEVDDFIFDKIATAAEAAE